MIIYAPPVGIGLSLIHILQMRAHPPAVLHMRVHMQYIKRCNVRRKRAQARSAGFLLRLAQGNGEEVCIPIRMAARPRPNAALDMVRHQLSLIHILTALIVTFFDVTLMLACFFGVGALMERFRWLQLGVLLVGSLIVCWIGIGLLRSKATLDTSRADVNMPVLKLAGKACVVTWFNPQALIDLSLIHILTSSGIISLTRCPFSIRWAIWSRSCSARITTSTRATRTNFWTHINACLLYTSRCV